MFGLTPVAACDSGSFAMSVSAVFAGQATPNTPGDGEGGLAQLEQWTWLHGSSPDFPVS